jgi:hypothetical protein
MIPLAVPLFFYFNGSDALFYVETYEIDFSNLFFICRFSTIYPSLFFVMFDSKGNNLEFYSFVYLVANSQVQIIYQEQFKR